MRWTERATGLPAQAREHDEVARAHQLERRQNGIVVLVSQVGEQHDERAARGAA
jgi:hypothetical protein